MRKKHVILLTAFGASNELFIFVSVKLIPIFYLLVMYYSYEMVHNILISISKGHLALYTQDRQMMTYTIIFLVALGACLTYNITYFFGPLIRKPKPFSISLHGVHFNRVPLR